MPTVFVDLLKFTLFFEFLSHMQDSESLEREQEAAATLGTALCRHPGLQAQAPTEPGATRPSPLSPLPHTRGAAPRGRSPPSQRHRPASAHRHGRSSRDREGKEEGQGLSGLPQGRSHSLLLPTTLSSSPSSHTLLTGQLPGFPRPKVTLCLRGSWRIHGRHECASPQAARTQRREPRA